MEKFLKNLFTAQRCRRAMFFLLFAAVMLLNSSPELRADALYLIADGELPSGAATEGDGYVEFNIPLKYKNLTDQPTHIIVVCSSSKYGDYMTGGAGSTLYVDDLSLIYDGTPTIWE